MPPASERTALRLPDQEWIVLLGEIAAGNQAALGTFYDATNRVVFGLIQRILNDPATAEEVLLDVYKQVWRQAASYDRARGTPLAWLMTIARSRAIDRLRAGWQEQQRKEPLDSANDARDETAGPEESTALAERRKLVREAMRALAPEQRKLIEMAYYGGLSHSEIALQTALPLGTVKTRIRLGMLRLKDLLSPVLQT